MGAFLWGGVAVRGLLHPSAGRTDGAILTSVCLKAWSYSVRSTPRCRAIWTLWWDCWPSILSGGGLSTGIYGGAGRLLDTDHLRPGRSSSRSKGYWTRPRLLELRSFGPVATPSSSSSSGGLSEQQKTCGGSWPLDSKTARFARWPDTRRSDRPPGRRSGSPRRAGEYRSQTHHCDTRWDTLVTEPPPGPSRVSLPSRLYVATTAFRFLVKSSKAPMP